MQRPFPLPDCSTLSGAISLHQKSLQFMVHLGGHHYCTLSCSLANLAIEHLILHKKNDNSPENEKQVLQAHDLRAAAFYIIHSAK